MLLNRSTLFGLISALTLLSACDDKGDGGGEGGDEGTDGADGGDGGDGADGGSGGEGSDGGDGGDGGTDCPDGDTDGDGVCDGEDLCAGDDATGDTDSDGVCDDTDVCTGDDATGDTDTDGVCDDLDVCTGDDATGDTDADGICDDVDLCTGDDATGDTDTDGVCDDLDICDGDDATGDTDEDELCDDTDPDDDDDGCEDGDDANPLTPSVDEDGDGSPQDCDPCFGNDSNGDADGDGICDAPFDLDGDGCLDIIDSDAMTPGTDSDGDGFADECDFCPGDATSACAAWGVSKSASSILYYDTVNYEGQLEVELTEASGTVTVTGLNGLAVDPTSSIPYVVMKDSSSRHLASVDLTTAEITVIGDFGEPVSDIAFDATGTLYAVTGTDATSPETLYTVDLATGALTMVVALGNGNDGEALAYCPDDGLMYHLSGTGSTMVFESIDLATTTVTSITTNLDSYEALSFAWDPALSAFQVNFRGGNAITLDTSGTAAATGTWSAGSLSTLSVYLFRLKGLVVVD